MHGTPRLKGLEFTGIVVALARFRPPNRQDAASRCRGKRRHGDGEAAIFAPPASANLGGLAEAGLAGFLGPSDAQQINDRQQRAQTRQPIDDIGDQRVGADAEVVNGDP